MDVCPRVRKWVVLVRHSSVGFSSSPSILITEDDAMYGSARPLIFGEGRDGEIQGGGKRERERESAR